MKKILILMTALTLNASAFADDATINSISQLAGAMGMGMGANTNTNTKISNAVANTKSNATDLLAAEKAAAGQQKSNASATADLAALVLAQRGGKPAEYAKMYQGMQGDANANSNALDTEIKNLSSMNEQLSEIQVYQKYKNCSGSTPTYMPPPTIMPVVAPVSPRITPIAVTTHATTTMTKKTHSKKMKKKKSTHH
jgi:hypothetical protein